VSALRSLFQELAGLPSATLTAVTALAGATAAVIVALISAVIAKFLVTPFLGGRDKQDKEAEWRKHAIELTKLDLERKLKTRRPTDTHSLRPSILDFLANYRDLQELDKSSPKNLYQIIKHERITKQGSDAQKATDARVELGHPEFDD
jgi:hypothetical protein